MLPEPISYAKISLCVTYPIVPAVFFMDQSILYLINLTYDNQIYERHCPHNIGNNHIYLLKTYLTPE